MLNITVNIWSDFEQKRVKILPTHTNNSTESNAFIVSINNGSR